MLRSIVSLALMRRFARRAVSILADRFNESCNHTHDRDACFILGIGSNAIREKFSEEISAPWYTAIHPSAQLGMGVHIGAGSVVMAGALINAEAEIGSHCIVNTGAVIEHDNVLEDFVHVSPNAALCGTVRIGHGTHVGAGSIVKNNCTICPNCILGAGAVVVRDITEPGTYIGVPARKIK